VTAHAETPAIRSLLRRPNLTAERERHLLRTCRAGRDEKARQQALSELWESHSKLVVAVARQFRRPDLEMTDLVGAGHLGMHAAIEGFDPDRFDSRLSTYAIRWIRHYIQDYIRRHAFPVRPPASTAHRQLFRTTGRLFADARRSCHREGIAASDGELCGRVGARIGLSGDEVAQCLSLARGDALPFDAPDTDERFIEAGLASRDASPEDAVIHRLDHAKLRRRIMVLTGEVLGERERKVFLARCMTDDEAATHLESLAAQLGVTRERVHQLEASAKRKIAVALTRDGLLDPANGGLELPRSRAPRRTHATLVGAPH
jgi:RNA polymerase sigma factor (sigma-70 family)